MKYWLILLLSLLPSTSLADVIIGDDIMLSSQYGIYPPFMAEVYSGGEIKQEFLTFCVEPQTLVVRDTLLKVENISTVSSDDRLLTGYSSWVYEHFLNIPEPLLGTYFGGIKWNARANAYTNAIWAGMVFDDGLITADDVGAIDSGFGGYYGRPVDLYASNTLYDDIGILLSDFDESNWYSGTLDEKLRHTDGYAIINFSGAQDIITQVPEPSTFVCMLGLIIIGIVGFMLNKNKICCSI